MKVVNNPSCNFDTDMTPIFRDRRLPSIITQAHDKIPSASPPQLDPSTAESDGLQGGSHRQGALFALQ
jgi:hypothetical protein